MDVKCDVLVVGAGPAGGVASLVLSKENLDVFLIEKNKQVGLHTGTKIDVTPQEDIDSIITQFGLVHNGIGHASNWHSPNGEIFSMKSELGEFYFKRGHESDSFEKITVESAVENGCNVCKNATIKTIELKDNLFHLRLSTGLKIKSKYLIAGDGSNSVILKKFLGDPKGKQLVGFGVSGYDFDVDYGTSEIYFDTKMIPGGYVYLVKSKDGLASSGIVLDPSKLSETPKKLFSSYKKKNKELGKRLKGKIISEFKGNGCVGGLQNIGMGNLLFVGDAGRLASPFLGYGMRSAILSSYLASNAIIGAINGNVKKIDRYDIDCKDRLNIDSASELASAWEKLHNEDLNIFFNILNEFKNTGKKLGIAEKIKLLRLLRKSDKANELKTLLKLFEELA